MYPLCQRTNILVVQPSAAIYRCVYYTFPPLDQSIWTVLFVLTLDTIFNIVIFCSALKFGVCSHSTNIPQNGSQWQSNADRTKCESANWIDDNRSFSELDSNGTRIGATNECDKKKHTESKHFLRLSEMWCCRVSSRFEEAGRKKDEINCLHKSFSFIVILLCLPQFRATCFAFDRYTNW